MDLGRLLLVQLRYNQFNEQAKECLQQFKQLKQASRLDKKYLILKKIEFSGSDTLDVLNKFSCCEQ